MSRGTFDAFATPSRIDVPRAVSMPSVGPTGTELELRVPDVGPEWIAELAAALRSKGTTLAERPAADVAAALGRAGERFLDPRDPVREAALAALPETSGLSPAMSEALLDRMAVDWTEERLRALLDAELGGPAALDGFVGSSGRKVLAVGPRLCVQIVAGSVPGVGVSALVRSLLVKGPTLLKPGRGDAVLPVLYARALADVDRALADALAVVYWPGGSRGVEDAALAAADVVTAYGSDATVSELRGRIPVTARFVAYHHRVSVGLVGREALTRDAIGAVAADVAEAVAFFDQKGCVSPQAVYVEEGGELSPADFVRQLGTALRVVEERMPSGPLGVGEASALQQARGTAELLASTGSGAVVHGGPSPWTVALEQEPGEAGPTAGRYVRVRVLADATDIARALEPLFGHLQTVGVAGLGERLERVAEALAVAGASRVTPFSEVAFPRPWWHHDGGEPLRDLVRWVDLERGDDGPRDGTF